MNLKLIDKSTSKEYYFDESDYTVTYLYESAFSRFSVRIHAKFENEFFMSQLEFFADEIKDSDNLEAQLILNGNIQKTLNTAFDKYELTHNKNIFGSQEIIESICLKCL